MRKSKKVLIIRFSSFGDIAQALPCADALVARSSSPESSQEDAEVHWLTRKDFADFVDLNPSITKVWAYDRKSSLAELLRLAFELRKQNFTHVYDAHSNLRSHLVSCIVTIARFHIQFVRRPKNRIQRFLLFTLRINRFPKPFRGILSYLSPIQNWGTSTPQTSPPLVPPPMRLQFNPDLAARLSRFITLDRLQKAVVFAPSATWELKRWPLEHWKSLAQMISDKPIVLLGGPEDTFCADIAAIDPERILNLTGQLSWVESSYVVHHAAFTIAGDTGLMHVADIVGRPAIAIIGPTAFGFPTRATTIVAETPLDCRPCTKDGRGQCTNATYQKCLRDVTPQSVLNKLKSL